MTGGEPAVGEEGSKLGGQALAQLTDGEVLLLQADLVVLFLLIRSLVRARPSAACLFTHTPARNDTYKH